MLKLFYLYFSEKDVEKVALSGAVLKEVQQLLQKLNLYQGSTDGNYSPEVEKALTDFYHQENFGERTPKERVIPSDILDYMRERAQ